MLSKNMMARLGLTGLVVVGGLVGAVLVPNAAKADLIINVNGTQQANDPTNTFAIFTGSVGNFNINSITATGVTALGGSGTLLDIGSLNVNSTGDRVA
jgi:hypothetical protein